MVANRIETLIIGGGQAGLATSYCLKQHGKEHIVLERADRAGHAWRQRWDSFTLVTPNWTFRLPGAEYKGANPDGFMPRDEIVGTFERYAADNALPISFGEEVTAIEPLEDRPGYTVRTQRTRYEAQHVVMATGIFQHVKIPAFAADLAPGIEQRHSEQYRNPAALPPGAVLVVGSGQSGCQIAEELCKSGRKVFLSIGSAGRVPRRYRGRDIFEWLEQIRFLDRTPEALPSPKARFAAIPHVSGAGGGHDLNLHQFARDGVTLLGHLRGATDGRIVVAPDVHDSLAKADQFEARLLSMIDEHIARTGIDAPNEQRPVLRDGYDQPQITEVGVRAEDITSVVWATGYGFDFSLVKLPICDADGFPVQQRGITAAPGIYFAGLPWAPTQKTGLLMGVGEQVAFIAETIAQAR
jgi:putative flavoprotein involved in K+ transport